MEHSFAKSLDKSKQDDLDPIWDKIRKHFWGHYSIEFYDGNNALQHCGIDEIITYYKNGIKSRIFVQRKVRFFNKKRTVYNDIVLETFSDKEKGVLGWLLHSDIKSDYLLYLNRTNNFCYLINFKHLRNLDKSIWKKFKKYYSFNVENNRKWTTEFITITEKFLIDKNVDFQKVDIRTLNV